MNESTPEFFDKTTGAFSKKYVDQFLCFLRDHTPQRTFTQIGDYFDIKNNPSTIITIMKKGRMLVKKQHVQTFAQHVNTDIDSLLCQFAATIQKESGSCLMDDNKTDGPLSPTEQTERSPSSNAAHDASLFVPKHMHDQFLFDLQKILGIRDDTDCLAALNENQVDTTRSNLRFFRETGQIPEPWMTLIAQNDAQKVLAEYYTPVELDEKQQAIEPPPSSCSDEKKQLHLSPVQCTCLQDVPAPFVNAFFDALYRAGKAARINCALPTFVGTLALHLPDCTVSIKSSDATSVIISIHDGKVAAEFLFDPVAVFS